MVLFQITPKTNSSNFTKGTAYDVLATGQDENRYPVLLVADENKQLRFVEGSEFKYKKASSTPTRKRAPNKKKPAVKG